MENVEDLAGWRFGFSERLLGKVVVVDFSPVVLPLFPVPDPVVVFQRLSGARHCLWLDSALRQSELGRYSFLAVDPVVFFTGAGSGGDPLVPIESAMAGFRAERVEGLPPFQGGAAGLFGYELGGAWERVPAARVDEFGVPRVAIGIYDVVVAWDHLLGRAWLMSQGFPERDRQVRRDRADARARQMLEWIERGAPSQKDAWVRSKAEGVEVFQQHRLGGRDVPAGLTSNFSADGYCRAVNRAIEYIRAGDIFQVNLSQRFLFPIRDESSELYLRLRRRNPATFAAFFDLGEFQILSASPERFVQVRQGLVETRPIKGTRRRMASAEADLFMGDALQESEKDRAENVMIVDLLRNDLSRVCTDDSVQVTQLCGLETYEFVLHLVSAVRGELAPGKTVCDLIRAAFPGGSITGAPKIRAMEIVAELEPTVRGPYCGSLGYLGFDGSADLNILIRTITSGRGWRQFPAGGGIVAQSLAEDEYEETWHKAAGMIKSLC